MRFMRLPALLGMSLLLSGALQPVAAHEFPPVGPAAPGAQVGPGFDSGMDPVMRALLIAMAARMLTEAARSSDPMEALGESMERALASVLRSPATARMLEDLMGHALKDVPAELRGPLALFAGSMLQSMRRDSLENRSPRTPY